MYVLFPYYVQTVQELAALIELRYNKTQDNNYLKKSEKRLRQAKAILDR